MSKATAATRVLTAAHITYTVQKFAYDAAAESIGLHAARELGEEPGRVVKTLMVLVDGRPVCVMAPSDREVSMKKLAAALGGRSAEMMKPAEAERLSGFRVGGISPFGQRRTGKTVIEQSLLMYEYVFVNGGQRGLVVRLAPEDARSVVEAVVADVMV
ncbi:MAG: Cys-tRNA(Pro) deacylase [Alphaproteobacteria bacterium]|nr:Cys-tRNA(Pro) deacylase [Alphaproteobacteria bacterium]